MPPRVSLLPSEILAGTDYLEPYFDPATLNIAALTNILQSHDVDTRPAKGKRDLLLMWDREIRQRADELKRVKEKAMRKSPKGNGIRDGMTGRLIKDEEEEEETSTPIRRSTRRSSRAPETPTLAAHSSRRQSAVRTPNSRGPSGKYIPVDLDEPSTDEDAAPQNLLSARRKSVRVNAPPPTEETSPFTKENIFQRGSPETSPNSDDAPIVRARPRPSAARAAPPPATSPQPRRRTRASMSAPPELPQATPDADDVFSTDKDDVDGVPSPGRGQLLEDLIESDEDEDDVNALASPASDDETAVASHLAERLGSPSLTTGLREGPAPFNPLRLLPFLPVLLALYILTLFKISSSAIGYCEPNSSTNPVIQDRVFRREHDLSNSPPLPEWLEPLRCTPCPANATCHPLTVPVCEPPLVLKPHFLDGLGIFNGFPGFGSVAFPPTCVEDETWKRKVGGLGRFVEGHLASLRGDRICQGVDEQLGSKVAEVKWAGMKKKELKDLVLRQPATKKMKPGSFDDIFANALKDMEKEELVIVEADENGEDWIAAKIGRMGFGCRLRVQARRKWREYRIYVALSSFLLLLASYSRYQLVLARAESARATSLIPAVLAALQSAEYEHHLDPASSPSAAVSSSQLRDAMLSEEHSITTREKVWKKVAAIVESNANVRVAEEEVGGELGRAWRWVGKGSSPMKRVEAKY